MRKSLPLPTGTCLATVFVLLFNIAARADDLDNITFQGVVRDGAGAAIVGARVQVIQTATGVERAVSTDAEGRYRVIVNAPGGYTIKVVADGFRATESREIAVASGRVVAMDFALQPSGISEQVTVTSGNAPLVDTTRTVTGDTVTRRELDELPIVNRDPLQLVFLLGGVAEAPLLTADLADEGRGVFVRNSPEEAGLFSLTGSPATSNNLTIDGMDNNDDRAARERITLNPEAIAEVQIITNQYAAEYGRASGGRINLRTRGGASQLRGEGYFYFGDESLNANTYFRNARGLGRVPQQQRRAGAIVSGPIIPQKHFFFADYERLDVTDFAEINATVPVATNPLFPLPPPNQPVSTGSAVGLFADEVSTPETRNVINTRADFNFAVSHNASARFDAQRGTNKRGFPGGARLLDTILIGGRDSDSISLTDNYIFSSRLVNQARAQYSRLLPRNRAGADSISLIIRQPERVTAGSYTGTNGSPAFAREERRFQIQDSLSLIFGNHLVKAGVDAQLVRSSFTDLFATGGEYTFASVEDFLANQPEQFVQRFDTASETTNNVTGLFAQDEWHVRPNLTLSFGMRWDNESILKDHDNFSPRVAVAWDPFGGKLFRKKRLDPGKTVVRAGFGVFYNRALLRTIDDFSLGRSTLTIDSDITPALLDSVKFPAPVSDRTLVDRFGIRESSFLRRVSADLEIPYTLQTGLGVERQITKNMVVTADYIFTRGAHLWRETNINAPRLPSGFASFTDYLLSRDFDNRPNAVGKRPVSGTGADVVRFDLGANTSTTAGAIQTVNGVRILTLGLNTPGSANITAALNAVRFLRPDPALTQVEMLESVGNSFYHGGIFSLRYRAARRVQLRGVYTLSKLIDEGTTNTASPQDLFDRRAERALSLQDQRHRFTFSGIFQIPRIELDLAPIISFGSSRPFNVGSGSDRNLNDIDNDRPNFIAPIGPIEWRRPGRAPAGDVKALLQLAPIGSDGNLPRNYGRGPGTESISLRASRTIRINEHLRLRPAVDVFNLFNKTTFSYGAEFIDRNDADFLLPRRTQRPRVIQLNIKAWF